MEVTIKPSLGDMNPDILMQIIDSAHEIGIYDIGHTLAQVNRYLASIVKLYSRCRFIHLYDDIDTNVIQLFQL